MNLPSFDPKEITRAIVATAIGLSAISATLILSAALAVAAYFSLRLMLVFIRILEESLKGGGL